MTTCTITVIDADLAEPEMLSKCLERCCWWIKDAAAITIFINKRVPIDAPEYNSPGWLEYIMQIQFNGWKMTVGAIQRKPGMNVEFHS